MSFPVPTSNTEALKAKYPLTGYIIAVNVNLAYYGKHLVNLYKTSCRRVAATIYLRPLKVDNIFTFIR